MVSYVILAIVILLNSNSYGQVSQVGYALVRELSEELIGKTLLLKGSINNHPKTYFKFEGATFFYAHDNANPDLFRRPYPIKVEIKDVVRGAFYNNVIIKFQSNEFGEGAVTVSSDKNRKITKETILKGVSLCFSPLSENSTQAIVLNPISRLCHVEGNNHFSVEDSTAITLSVEEEIPIDYKKCELCFKRYRAHLYESAYENEIGKLLSVEINSSISFSSNNDLQSLVDSLGNDVLENWPLPLMGYDYNFILTNENELEGLVNATGDVYISEKLLSTSESNIEIESVIVNHIAHTEMRHIYRSYLDFIITNPYANKSAKLVSDYFMFKNKKELDINKNFVKTDAKFMIALLRKLSGSDFTKEFTSAHMRSLKFYLKYEEEADIITLFYLAKKYKGDLDKAKINLNKAFQKSIYSQDYDNNSMVDYFVDFSSENQWEKFLPFLKVGDTNFKRDLYRSFVIDKSSVRIFDPPISLLVEKENKEVNVELHGQVFGPYGIGLTALIGIFKEKKYSNYFKKLVVKTAKDNEFEFIPNHVELIAGKGFFVVGNHTDPYRGIEIDFLSDQGNIESIDVEW